MIDSTPGDVGPSLQSLGQDSQFQDADCRNFCAGCPVENWDQGCMILRAERQAPQENVFEEMAMSLGAHVVGEDRRRR